MIFLPISNIGYKVFFEHLAFHNFFRITQQMDLLNKTKLSVVMQSKKVILYLLSFYVFLVVTLEKIT